MPQYYSGADPTQAFSNGLMAGYEFIDRIKARAEQVRLQKLQEARSAEAFEMQKQGFATNQKLADLQIKDTTADIEDEGKERKYRDEQRPILESRAKKEYEQRIEATGLGIEAARGQIGERKDLKRGREAYAELLPTLGGIGAQGLQTVQDPQVGAGTVLRNDGAAPAATPTAATAPQTNSLDLRARQAAVDAEPGPIGKAIRSVKDAVTSGAAGIGEGLRGKTDPAEYWNSIANPKKVGTSGREIAEANIARNIRSNPLAVAPDYLRDRPNVREEDRAALDYTMSQAATEQIANVSAEIRALGPAPANQLKVKRLQTQLEQAKGVMNDLSKAMGKTVGAEVLPGGGAIAGDDPKVLPAITKAAQANEAAGVLPKVTQEGLRLTQTQLGRMGNPTRLTPKQLNLLSEAFRTGYLDPTTYTNWLQYGGPLAPAPPKVIPFGSGKGVVLYPNGQLAELDFGSGKGKGGRGGDGGATIGQAIEFVKDSLNARIKRGDIPDAVEGTGIHEMGQMMLFLQRYAPEFQANNPEVELLDENGEMSMEWMKDPLDALKVMNYYVNRKNGLDEPDETVDPLPEGPGAMPVTPVMQ